MKDFLLGIALLSLLHTFANSIFIPVNLKVVALHFLVFLLAMVLRLRPKIASSKNTKTRQNRPKDKCSEQDQSLPFGHIFIKKISQKVCTSPWCECEKAEAVRTDEGWIITVKEDKSVA